MTDNNNNRILCFSCADAISETNPRVIDDTRARKLAADLKRCSYYETCATYGLNVDRVFQDGKNIIDVEFFLIIKEETVPIFCYVSLNKL